MKNLARWVVVLAMVSLLNAGVVAEEKAKVPSLRVAIDLLDGSRIVGVSKTRTMPIRTAYTKMDVALDKVVSVTINGDRETASFVMGNGDRIKGVTNLKSLAVQTVFGKLELDMAHIKRIAVTPTAVAHLPREFGGGYHLMTGEAAKLKLRDVGATISFEKRTWQINQPKGYITFFQLPVHLALRPPRNSKTGAVNMKRHLFTYGAKVGVYTTGTSNARTKPKILGSVPVRELRLAFDGTWAYALGGGGKIFVHSGG